MASERDEQLSGNDNTPLTTGQRSRENEFGERGERPDDSSSETMENRASNDRRGDGMSGQPIGGNDSATGTGTTLTQGADFAPEESPSGVPDTDISAGSRAPGSGGAATGDGPFGQGTTSNSGGSSVDTDQTSGGSSGTAGGEGFIGSDAEDSDKYLRNEQGSGEGIKDSAGAAATRGNDFASKGQGALDDEDETRPNSTSDGPPA